MKNNWSFHTEKVTSQLVNGNHGKQVTLNKTSYSKKPDTVIM